MADTDVGKTVTFHSEDGPKEGKIVHYDSGHDPGDHVVEFAAGGDDAYTGTVVRRWSVDGHQTGAFTINK